MRSFDGKPEPTPQANKALLRMILNVTDALSEVHGRNPRNIETDWLPPKDWTPEDDG